MRYERQEELGIRRSNCDIEKWERGERNVEFEFQSATLVTKLRHLSISKVGHMGHLAEKASPLSSFISVTSEAHC